MFEAMRKQRIRCNNPDEYGRLAEPDAEDHVMSGWGSILSQDVRLMAMLRLPLRPGDLVVDFGCGSGRLADLVMPEVEYLGLDWSEEVIAEAKRRRPGRHFEVGGVERIPEAEWVVASGVFNVAVGWSKANTCRVVREMWGKARRGIAITVLSCSSEADRLSYSPWEMTKWMAGLDWAELEIDRSYLPHDACLRVLRQVSAEQ